MAKSKFKYFLNPGTTGDLHVKAPADRKEGGKYVLSSALSQEDLEYLYESADQKNIITRVEIPAGKNKSSESDASEKKGKGK